MPTGNFGDVLAGYFAKRMGLPVGRLGIATNANDILARFWRSGAYEKVDSSAPPTPSDAPAPTDGKQATAGGGVLETLSPAMDILVSSNFERLLWYLAFEAGGGADARAAGATIADWMGRVKQDGRVEVPVAALEFARRDFFAERVSDEQTLETIRFYFESDAHYVADPHTAVGLCAARAVAPLKCVSPCCSRFSSR